MGAFLRGIFGGASELLSKPEGTYTTLKFAQATFSLINLHKIDSCNKAISMISTARAVTDGTRVFHEPWGYFRGHSFQLDQDVGNYSRIFSQLAWAVLNVACAVDLFIDKERLAAKIGNSISLFRPVLAKVSLGAVIKYSYLVGLVANAIFEFRKPIREEEFQNEEPPTKTDLSSHKEQINSEPMASPKLYEELEKEKKWWTVVGAAMEVAALMVSKSPTNKYLAFVSAGIGYAKGIRFSDAVTRPLSLT